MTRSLRGRLTLYVFAALAVVLIGFSALLDRLVARALEQQLEDRLASEWSALAGMVEQEPDRPVEFEYVSQPDFEAGRPACFQVWSADGAVLARSPSLGATRDLLAAPPMDDAPRYAGLRLPDGREGRRLYARRSSPPATIVVARDTREIAGVLARVRLGLAGLSVLALAAAAGAARAAVAHGLRPVDALAAEIAALDETRLARSLSTDRVPAEMEPMATKLRDLLLRLDQALAREKRFSADVSHELRTPLAALRTILELAVSRSRSAAEYRAALDEALPVVLHLGALAENLLMLARIDAGAVEVRAADIALHDLVEACWRPLAARADGKALVFANEVPAAARLASDETKLRLVVHNLLDNAVEYTAAGGRIAVRHRPEHGVWLEVWDSGPPIATESLPRLFDRFYRADAARAGESHAGIGLTLVKSLCDVLGAPVRVRNGDEGSVSFTVGQRQS